jgi:hypothetical protein
MFGTVRIFVIKLKLFRKKFENFNSRNFSSCDLLLTDGSVNVPLPSARAVEIILLLRTLKMAFNDFRSHATNISISENPFSVK